MRLVLSVDRDNMRYLNAIYHGPDNTRLGGRISGELTPGYFLSADAVRTVDIITVRPDIIREILDRKYLNYSSEVG